MLDIKKLLAREQTCYRFFSGQIAREYGVLYHNPDNPLSYDSNHAHILDLNCDLEAAIRDFVLFYRERNITPRIYSSYIDNELDKLRPHLEAAGFEIKIDASEFMLYTGDGSGSVDPAPSVRRITQLTDDIVELIHSEDAGDWGINVIKKCLPDAVYHLLGRFQDNKCVAIASVRLMDEYSRVDDVMTHKDFRGKHYATELMRYLVIYHRAISTNYLYLWAMNPIAIKMYKNVGFQPVPVSQPTWEAFLK